MKKTPEQNNNNIPNKVGNKLIYILPGVIIGLITVALLVLMIVL